MAGPTAAAAADPLAVNPSTDLNTNVDPTVASPGCLDQHEQNANTMHLFLHRVAGNFSSAALQTLHDDQGTLSPEQRQAHLTAVAADSDARTATLKASLPAIVAKHQRAVDPFQHLASCAACGVRQMYPDTPYTRHTLAEMRILQFNTTDSPADAAKQLRIESAGEYGVVFSYFDDGTTVPPTRWHLHREFVDAPGPLTDATDPSALLCGTCTKNVGNYSRPTNSIAAGIDYGCLQRYFHDHGAPLTDLELAAISCARVVQTIIKVSGANAGRGQQLASRAQSVVVLQPTGPEVLAACHAQTLPRRDLAQFVTVLFVGPKGQCDARFNSTCKSAATTLAPPPSHKQMRSPAPGRRSLPPTQPSSWSTCPSRTTNPPRARYTRPLL